MPTYNQTIEGETLIGGLVDIPVLIFNGRFQVPCDLSEMLSRHFFDKIHVHYNMAAYKEFQKRCILVEE